MTTTESYVRVTTIPFAPAVRWNMRSHLLLTDLVALATVLLVFAVATTIPWRGADFVFGSHDLAVLLAFALGALGALAACDQYDGRCVSSLRRDLSRVLPAVLVGGAAAFAVGAFVKFVVEPPYGVASQMLAAGLVAMSAMLVAARVGTHAARDYHPASLMTEDRVLVLGDGERAAAFTAQLVDADRFALPTQELTATGAEEFEQSLRAQLDAARPARLVIAFDEPSSMLQPIAVREAVQRGIDVRILPHTPDPDVAELIHNGLEPVAAFVGARERQWQWHAKLVLDRVLAAALLLALSPLLVAIALAIWIGDRGPVLYRQPRISLYGRPFGVWKFRSMRVDADARLRELLASDPDAHAEWGRDQKLRSDPRITRVGAFIRTWSIDELPQLINVLTGEMSLVGPRPIVEDEIDKYGARFVFGRAKPGMTGLWQVSGRNQTTYERRIELDEQYVERWSLWLDAKIIVRTVLVVLQRDGAY